MYTTKLMFVQIQRGEHSDLKASEPRKIQPQKKIITGHKLPMKQCNLSEHEEKKPDGVENILTSKLVEITAKSVHLHYKR